MVKTAGGRRMAGIWGGRRRKMQGGGEMRGGVVGREALPGAGREVMMRGGVVRWEALPGAGREVMTQAHRRKSADLVQWMQHALGGIQRVQTIRGRASPRLAASRDVMPQLYAHEVLRLGAPATEREEREGDSRQAPAQETRSPSPSREKQARRRENARCWVPRQPRCGR